MYRRSILSIFRDDGVGIRIGSKRHCRSTENRSRISLSGLGLSFRATTKTSGWDLPVGV